MMIANATMVAMVCLLAWSLWRRRGGDERENGPHSGFKQDASPERVYLPLRRAPLPPTRISLAYLRGFPSRPQLRTCSFPRPSFPARDDVGGLLAALPQPLLRLKSASIPSPSAANLEKRTRFYGNAVVALHVLDCIALQLVPVEQDGTGTGAIHGPEIPIEVNVERTEKPRSEA